MKALSYEKGQGVILVDIGPERVEVDLCQFENWLEENNLLYHGIAEPDEYETPTGRWSVEAFWEYAPESMILSHISEFMQSLCLQ